MSFMKSQLDLLTDDIAQDEEEAAEYVLRIGNNDAGTRTQWIGITARQAERVLELLDELGEDDNLGGRL